MNHTPGPWVLDSGRIEADAMPTWRQINPKCSDPEGARAPVCIFKQPSSLGMGDYHAPGAKLLVETNDANARLIAAAPDLLAVVKLIVKEWEAPTDGTTRGELIGRLSQYTSEAYAALKKAGVLP